MSYHSFYISYQENSKSEDAPSLHMDFLDPGSVCTHSDLLYM